MLAYMTHERLFLDASGFDDSLLRQGDEHIEGDRLLFWAPNDAHAFLTAPWKSSEAKSSLSPFPDKGDSNGNTT